MVGTGWREAQEKEAAAARKCLEQGFEGWRRWVREVIAKRRGRQRGGRTNLSA